MPWYENSVLSNGGLAVSASWSFIAAGSAASILAAAVQNTGNTCEEWGCVAIGLWLLATPWVLGFSGNLPAAWTAVLCGGSITAQAVSCIAQGPPGGGKPDPASDRQMRQGLRQ
ncbi:SPW repeat protein [Leisingera sp.]|uniref:SPW repeat protein n=1 Tax=Leisingera sp. TaxID=1879318 RepID=UPI003A5C50CF